MSQISIANVTTNMKYIFRLIIAAVILTSTLDVQTAAAESVTGGQLLTSDFSGKADRIVGAIGYWGGAVVTYPVEDNTGIQLSVRTDTIDDDNAVATNGGRWLDGIVIPNDEVVDSNKMIIRDLQVSVMTTHSDSDSNGVHLVFISWIAAYYDPSDVFIKEIMHLYAIELSGYDGTVTQPSYWSIRDDAGSLPEAFTSSTMNGISDVFITGGKVSVSLHLKNGGNIYTGYWTGQDEWDDSGDGRMSIITGLPSTITTTSPHLAIVQDANSFTIYQWDNTEATAVATTVGTYLNSVDTPDGLSAVFKVDGKVQLLTIEYEDGFYTTNTESVFSNLKNIESAKIAYNDYGAGQVMIAVRSHTVRRTRIHVALHRSTGWVKNKNIQVFAFKFYSYHIRAFENGNVQVLTHSAQPVVRDHLSQYQPGSSSWETWPGSVSGWEKARGAGGEIYYNNNWRASKIHFGNPIYANDGNNTIEWFWSEQAEQYIVARIDLASQLTITDTLSLPRHYNKYVLHTAGGDNQLILVKYKHKLYVVAGTEDELLTTNN